MFVLKVHDLIKKEVKNMHANEKKLKKKKNEGDVKKL